MKKHTLTINILSIAFFCASCTGQEKEIANDSNVRKVPSLIDEYVLAHPDDGKPSVSIGTVSKGSMVNGKLIPYSGTNFQYFADNSYLMGRAFVNSSLRNTLIESYHAMYSYYPEHLFYIMESSHKCGGKLDPHKTHQNGLSVDFMMPLTKNGKEYQGLDTIGVDHYYLNFDNEGSYVEDSSIKINFDIVAKHILELEKKARLNGLRISKVILKIELKDELYASKYGSELLRSGIYVVRSLTPIINLLHDEHYHIDFEPLE
jgi:penicillin-insensitive murein DD-endopeptidase